MVLILMHGAQHCCCLTPRHRTASLWLASLDQQAETGKIEANAEYWITQISA